MSQFKSEYYVEDGKLYCKDNVFDTPYEVTCTVAVFLEVLKLGFHNTSDGKEEQ